ncbi:MAG: SusD/RagB family nutrient-binding outer membrane lipoprotein [Flammeovirgaceae bacterium]|nr:SusD/RagB family nutrient-binding outer membrane lipoprotein [Flammeovirgaceae bacterium]
MREQNSPAMIYTSAQVALSMAEAVLDGWIPGNAQTLYEQGIQASLNQYGVGAGYAQYITNSVVAYSAATAKSQIGTQRWLATYLQGYEGWANWRRTGFPALAPAANAQTESGQIPRRQGYSSTERDLNGPNYDAALARQGFAQDDLDGRVWWDN